MRGAVLLLWLVGCAGGVDADGDGATSEIDCDDEDPLVFPGAPERCDGVDHDCDGQVDVGVAYTNDVQEYFLDDDFDGVGAASVGQACTRPADPVVTEGGDCNDANALVFPGADETCDGVDNDCDERTDDEDELDTVSTPVWYRDVDGDGYGSAAAVAWACVQPEGYVADGTDCDDSAEGADRNPGAPEICDGKDNNCDVEAGLLVDEEDPSLDLSSVPFWYRDRDGDGQGDLLTARQTCLAPPGYVDNSLDCDDADAHNFVGNPEVCDGQDNDCDGLIDGGAWWDAAWPYRVMLAIEAPADDTVATPIAVDIDFGQALAQAGDSSAFTPDSVRVVLQDCATGSVELPYDFLDTSLNLLERGPPVSARADEAGALAFRYDTDGLLATRETLPAGASVTVGVYFGSVGAGPVVTAPSWSTPMTVVYGGGPPTAPLIEIETGASRVVLDSAFGGVVSELRPAGGENLGSQTVSQFGNGVYFGPPGGGPTGGWVRASSGVATTFQVVHTGRVVSVARASGTVFNDHGGYVYDYRYLTFAGRPEVYAKVSYTLDRDSNVGPQGSFWTAAVRPWQTDNLSLVAGAGLGGRDAVGFSYAWGRYAADARGLWVGWRGLPLEIGAPVYSADGRYVGLSGQDHDPAPVGNEVFLPAGTVLLDGSVVVAYPYEGAQADWQGEALGVVAGVSVAAQPVEIQP